MSEFFLKTLIGIVIVLFVASVFTVARPQSDGGRLARKLCVANAIGWFVLLPLSTTGHPPPFLIPGILFWLGNLVLLPAAAMALRASHKEQEERTRYLAVAAAYVVLNVAILFVVPVVSLAIEST